MNAVYDMAVGLAVTGGMMTFVLPYIMFFDRFVETFEAWLHAKLDPTQVRDQENAAVLAVLDRMNVEYAVNHGEAVE